MATVGTSGGMMGMMNPLQQMQQMQLQQMLIQNQNSSNSPAESVHTNMYPNSLPNFAGACNSTQDLMASFANMMGGVSNTGGAKGKPEIEDLTQGPCLFCEGAHDAKNCDRMIKAKRAMKDELKEKNTAQRLKRLADAKAKAEANEN
jgi:hypothetical protein